MKKAFTLIELIFVIVIISLLASVAIPKYIHLKENARVISELKTGFDAVSSIRSTYINLRDLEGYTYKPSANAPYIDDTKKTFSLRGLVNLNAKDWQYGYYVTYEQYKYNSPTANQDHIFFTIKLFPDRLEYEVVCGYNSYQENHNPTVLKCRSFIDNKNYEKETIYF